MNVTPTAMKKVEMAGGFDNYILLTPANEMISMFGEYLRELMLRKINDPSLDTDSAEIFGTTPDVYQKKPMKF